MEAAIQSLMESLAISREEALSLLSLSKKSFLIRLIYELTGNFYILGNVTLSEGIKLRVIQSDHLSNVTLILPKELTVYLKILWS